MGHAVKNMDAAVVKQGGLRNRTPGRGRTDRALLQWFFIDFLDRFEAMTFSALVLVERHKRFMVAITLESRSQYRRDLVTPNISWYKISCLL